ncbi:MAG: DUF2442 domain-containing protein [Chromatiales bacterium]
MSSTISITTCPIHAKYAEFEASIGIADGEILAEELPRKQLRLVQAWVELHHDELMADWELAVGGESPYKIAPCEVAMYWDVKTVKPLPNYRIYVEIEDGRKGIFDLKPYLDRGVFRELRNVHYFNQVSILFGAVTWPNEQDIAPETLLAEMLPLEETNPPTESLQRTPLTLRR